MKLIDIDILVAGGEKDFNIIRFANRCNEEGIKFRSFLTGRTGTPKLTIDPLQNTLLIDQSILKTKAVFIRPDVFNYLESKNPKHMDISRDWFTSFIGYILGNPDISILNRRYFNRSRINKIETLIQAKKIGINVAETYFTNDVNLINTYAESGDWIEKPVDGGDHAKTLVALPKDKYGAGATSGPTTIQKKLVAPEVRIFRVGGHFHAFEIVSSALDYRTSGDTKIIPVSLPISETNQLEQLTDILGLDFAAADFKTNAETGNLTLLEVNSGPMFAGFDYVSEGKLTASMIDYLLNGINN